MDLSEFETWSLYEEEVTGRPVAFESGKGNPMHPVNQTTGEVQKLKEENGHTTYTCLQPQFIHHMEAVFSIVSNIHGREHADPLDDVDINMPIRGIFLNTTLQA